MDKEQAKNLIIKTFENAFNKDNLTAFLSNLLKEIEYQTFTYFGNFIPDAFSHAISSMERLGKYICDDKEIDLLLVTLKKETSLERARSLQRNFIAWYLKGSRGGKLKDAALVAFVSPGSEDQREQLGEWSQRFYAPFVQQGVWRL